MDSTDDEVAPDCDSGISVDKGWLQCSVNSRTDREPSSPARAPRSWHAASDSLWKDKTPNELQATHAERWPDKVSMPQYGFRNKFRIDRTLNFKCLLRESISLSRLSAIFNRNERPLLQETRRGKRPGLNFPVRGLTVNRQKQG